MSSSAFISTKSGNSVGKSSEAWPEAARVSCFKPDLTWRKYESLPTNVTLAMETNTRVGVKSLKRDLNPNPLNFFKSKSFLFQKDLNPNPF